MEEYISGEKEKRELLHLEIIPPAETSEYENFTRSSLPGDFEKKMSVGVKIIENDPELSDDEKSNLFLEMTVLEKELFLAKQ